MARYFDVKIVTGTAPGPYTVYWNAVGAQYIATQSVNNSPATGLTYTSLTTGTGVSVTVPDTITNLILYNESCSTSQTYVIPTPTPTPTTTQTPTKTPTNTPTNTPTPTKAEVLYYYQVDQYNYSCTPSAACGTFLTTKNIATRTTLTAGKYYSGINPDTTLYEVFNVIQTTSSGSYPIFTSLSGPYTLCNSAAAAACAV